jgi:hypothetical protein
MPPEAFAFPINLPSMVYRLIVSPSSRPFTEITLPCDDTIIPRVSVCLIPVELPSFVGSQYIVAYSESDFS